MRAATSASSLLSVIRGIASITKGGPLKSRGFDDVSVTLELSKRTPPHLLTPLWPSCTTPLSISMIRIYDLGEAADIAINSTFC